MNIIHRSFLRDVQEPLARIRDISVNSLCDVRYRDRGFPLLMVHSPEELNPDNPSLCISGGVHGGKEPAGVHAAIDFLKNEASHYAHKCNFAVFPCVNPSGYEAGTYETMSGANLNGLFHKRSKRQEIRAIEEWLKRTQPCFEMVMDLHEAPPDYEEGEWKPKDNPHTCFLYETMDDRKKRIGEKLIDALPSDTEVCPWKKIYGDASHRGVISYPEACCDPDYDSMEALDSYMYGKGYAKHAITTETPTLWSMEKRIATHMIWMKTAIELVLSRGT